MGGAYPAPISPALGRDLWVALEIPTRAPASSSTTRELQEGHRHRAGGDPAGQRHHDERRRALADAAQDAAALVPATRSSRPGCRTSGRDHWLAVAGSTQSAGGRPVNVTQDMSEAARRHPAGSSARDLHPLRHGVLAPHRSHGAQPRVRGYKFPAAGQSSSWGTSSGAAGTACACSTSSPAPRCPRPAVQRAHHRTASCSADRWR